MPEEGFAGRSFAAINEELTASETWWEGVEYVDFDNDGEDELIMQGYAGARLYLDVVGDMVYKVFKPAPQQMYLMPPKWKVSGWW